MRVRNLWATGGAEPDQRFIILDAVRGATALLVLGCHADSLGGGIPDRTAHNAAGFVLNSMAASVHLFFALSGFLVAGPFIRALVAGNPLPLLSTYVTRRATRIFPAYWIALGATLIVIKGEGVRLWQLPVHFLLLQELVPGESQMILFLAWTLGLEMIFYLALPIVARLVRRFTQEAIPVKTLAMALIAVWAVVAIVTPELDHVAAGQGLRSVVGEISGVCEGLCMFVPGMLVYLAELQFGSGERPWRINRLASNQPAALLVAAGVIFIVARVVWMAPASDVALRALVLWAISCGLALLALVRHPPSGRITHALAAVGTVSYGLYLWHGVIVTAAAHHPELVPLHHSGPLAYVVHLALLVSTSMALAILSWRLIEEPLIARSRRWRPRASPVTPPVETPLLEPAEGVPGT